MKVGSKIRAKVDPEMGLKSFPDQWHVDFVPRCNTHGVEATKANKLKIYDKDFMVWAKPESTDDSRWEDTEETFSKSGTLVVKNFAHGIHRKDAFVNFSDGYKNGGGGSFSYSNSKKTLLMKAEMNMLLMSPMGEGKLHSTGFKETTFREELCDIEYVCVLHLILHFFFLF
ncbi:hypothetical protein VNO80_10151 [Phaseolus coccineus]|uniref:DUF7135 domain-containing protein n=1 Tax=Phaseolus coccineus TaxID=3886 RepID=A0AAN9N7L0_PHACN